MIPPFLITGLPRSRTAWLSAFFTVGDCFCHHELSGSCKTITEVQMMMLLDDFPFCGNSDSGALLILDELIELIPGLRIVYVVRDEIDALSSFAKAVGMNRFDLKEGFGTVAKTFRRVRKQHPAVMELDYAEVGRRDRIQQMWRIITDGQPFPDEHYGKMMRLHVTQDPAYLHDAARKGLDCVLTRQTE